MKVVFGTTVYDKAFEFGPEYIESINSQDTNEFDLLLLNDNLKSSEIELIKNNLVKQPKILSNKYALEPHQLRVELIKWAKGEGYELLIFGDFDDKFSSDRISSVIEEFDSDFGFFYNTLAYFNDKNFFNELPSETNQIDDILEYNYIGLSHSALNLNTLSTELIDELSKSQNEIFDWYLYSLLLSEGIKGKRINSGKTYYRIHDDNIAGEDGHSTEDIIKELDVKIKHYRSLQDKSIKFKELLNKHLYLKENINNEELTDYVDTNKDYWWSKIKLKGMV